MCHELAPFAPVESNQSWDPSSAGKTLSFLEIPAPVLIQLLFQMCSVFASFLPPVVKASKAFLIMRMSLFSTNHWSQSLFLRIYEGKALGTRLHANWKFVNILILIFLLKIYFHIIILTRSTDATSTLRYTVPKNKNNFLSAWWIKFSKEYNNPSMPTLWHHCCIPIPSLSERNDSWSTYMKFSLQIKERSFCAICTYYVS